MLLNSDCKYQIRIINLRVSLHRGSKKVHKGHAWVNSKHLLLINYFWMCCHYDETEVDLFLNMIKVTEKDNFIQKYETPQLLLKQK